MGSSPCPLKAALPVPLKPHAQRVVDLRQAMGRHLSTVPPPKSPFFFFFVECHQIRFHI
jgi:hypothetical protein